MPINIMIKLTLTFAIVEGTVSKNTAKISAIALFIFDFA